MILLYILLVVYILAINFYAFLLVKSLKEKERAEEIARLEQHNNPYPLQTSSQVSSQSSSYSPAYSAPSNEKQMDKTLGKLLITGALGGAIAIYVCMFIYKYKRSELLLMVVMPLLAILNIYFWALLFKSGFHFFILR